MSKISKFLYGSRGCILSDVVVVHILIEIKNMQYPEW